MLASTTTAPPAPPAPRLTLTGTVISRSGIVRVKLPRGEAVTAGRSYLAAAKRKRGAQH
jgi:hypothetical protein